MGLGIVEFMMSMEDYFHISLPMQSETLHRVRTLGDLIDWLEKYMRELDRNRLNEEEIIKDVFDQLRPIIATVFRQDESEITMEFSLHQGTGRQQKQLRKAVGNLYHYHHSLHDRYSCLIFLLEAVVVAVSAVMAFVDWWALILFIAVFSFVLYDVLWPGPLFGHSISFSPKTLGELVHEIAPCKMPHVDQQGRPWTHDSIQSALFDILEDEFSMDRNCIDLSTPLSDLD